MGTLPPSRGIAVREKVQCWVALRRVWSRGTLGCNASVLQSLLPGRGRVQRTSPSTAGEGNFQTQVPTPRSRGEALWRIISLRVLLARSDDRLSQLMLLAAALLPLPRVRVGPRGGLAQLSAADEYAVRRCDMADPADAAAYRAVSQSRDALARPGVVQDAPERTVSVRWSTSASVTVLIAVASGPGHGQHLGHRRHRAARCRGRRSLLSEPTRTGQVQEGQR